jgi:hypothetical protein
LTEHPVADVPNGRRRAPVACWAGAALLAAVALFLPVHAIVEGLARHFRTVHDFQRDFIVGLQILRAACAVNAALLAFLPLLLAGVRFTPSPPGSWTPRDLRPAGALYGIALLLALPGLRESFQVDEWRCLLEYIRHGPLVIVTRSIGDNHHLYSLLAWPFVKLFGPGEASVRLPAILLGPLGPTLLYALLRRDHAPGKAFLAALPLAASPFLAASSHEGRAYAVLFPAILGLCLLQRNALAGSLRAWIGFIALGIAAVYLHLFASMAIVGVAAAAFLRPEGRTRDGRARNLAAFLLIAGVSLLLYAPVIAKFFEYSERVHAGGRYRGELSAISDGFVLPLSPFWAIPFALTFIGGAFSSKRPTPELVACLVAATLQIVVAEVSAADRAARLYAPALILAWPVIAAALVRLPRGMWLAAGLTVLTLAADVSYLRHGRRKYREAAEELDRRRKPGESLALFFDCRPMNAYLKESADVIPAGVLATSPPDWFMIVDENQTRAPEAATILDRDYEAAFRVPSARGAVLGYRRKSR